MRSRRRRARLIVWLLAVASIASTDAAAHAQAGDGVSASRFTEQREQFTPPGGKALELRFLITREAAGQSARIVGTVRETLSLLTRWFGPLPSTSLSISAVPWRAGAVSESRSGLVSAPVRWLAPIRDQSTERAVIAAMVRQYWAGGSRSPSPFEEAVTIYVATRAIHELLEGSNFAAPRFFGGVIPFPLRTLLLSPQVADPRPRFVGFAEVDHGTPPSDDVRGIVRGLQTLERYVGLPTMIEALSRLRAAAHDPATFADALSDARGTDVRALVIQCLTPSKTLEYALDDMQSRPGAAGMIETSLTVRRQSVEAFPTVPILVRFEDGTEVRDDVDGTAPSQTLVYSANAPARAAWIDPGLVVLLDRDRDNNAIVRDRPMSRLGVRMALQWMAWLQNAMLTYTAAL